MGMKNALKVVMLLLVFAVGCKPDEPNNGGDNNHLNGHEYVDLGLPSGTLWATCNVGADSPEDYGDYYAWGDTLPKTMYDWKSYPYATFVDGHYELTKYCMDSSCGFNGFVDDLTVLELVDDAVTANWVRAGVCQPKRNGRSFTKTQPLSGPPRTASREDS